LVGGIREDWLAGKLDPGATSDFLAALRGGSPKDASAKVVSLLNAGVAPQSIWDGLFAFSGECLLRQPGIVALHAVTTTNAMRYAFETASDDDTRKMLMLQNAAFLPMFFGAMKSRGEV